MGCGITTIRMFTINILDIVQTDQPRKGKIIQLHKEVFTMTDGTPISQYIADCLNPEVKSFIKNEALNKEAIFHFVFDDKTICVAEFEEAKYFIPKDRYAYFKKGKNPIVLSELYIIPIPKLEYFYLTKKEFYKQIEKVSDPRDFLFEIGDVGLADQPSELSLDSSVEEFVVSEGNDNQEREKKVFLPEKKDEESEEESLTDYDSDSSNSLEEVETEKPSELEVNNNIEPGILEEFDNIMNKEKNSEAELTTLSIKYNKIMETKTLSKLLTLASSIPQSKKNEAKTKDKSQKPQHLTKFEFFENKIDSNLERECWDIICSFLESKKTYKAENLDTKEINARKFKVLRNLDLSISNINDEYFKQIMISIRNIRLHNIDLHGNEISSLKRLSHWLIKNKSLVELNLRNNKNIKSTDIVEVINSIKIHKKILSLDISYIQLKDIGKHLSSLFIKPKDSTTLCKLKVLKIRECSLSYSDILEIYEGASAKNSTLEELDISGNNKQGNPEITKLLIGFISNCLNLSVLEIENNKVDQYQAISDAMGTKSFCKSKLIKLNISDPSLNYFNLLTSFIGEISNIKKKLTRDVEIIAINESKTMDEADRNIENEFKEHKSSIVFHFD